MTTITIPPFTGPWAESLTQYVELMLGLGRDFRTELALLRAFDHFVIAHGHTGPLIETLILDFAYAPPACTPANAQKRHLVLRRFAQYLRFFDPATEVPAPLEPSRQPARRLPHIYTDEEVQRLLAATLQLPPFDTLYPFTFYTLLGLLFSTGMRDGEALALDTDAIDFTSGVLHIRRTKFRKSRYVPVHATTLAVLSEYDQRRRARYPQPNTPAFFVNSKGRRLQYGTLNEVFLHLIRATRLRDPHGDGPRVHDMRHYVTPRIMLRRAASCTARRPVRVT